MHPLNDIQARAVHTIDQNVALIAGAGTGKTSVLTERFLYLLEKGNLPQGNEVESIVAITFTNKAAEEMRTRIQAGIAAKKDSTVLQAFQNQLNRLRISTIHTFCEQILRDDPVGAEVDPHFTILDEMQAEDLFQSALHEVFPELMKVPENTEVAIENEWFESNAFFENVSRIYQQIRASGTPMETVREKSLTFGAVDPESAQAFADRISSVAKGKARADKLKKTLAEIPDWERILYDGTREERREVYRKLHAEKAFGTAKALAGAQSALTPLLASMEHDLVPGYEFLLRLLHETDTAYRAKKRRIQALDFDDLQERVLEYLQDDEKRKTIREKIAYLMIDECQDINDLQKELFYALCSERTSLDRGNLFIVGDPRQSIYGFRYANAALFDRISEDIRQSGGVLLSMRKNYRSSEKIIEYVNEMSARAFPGLEGLEACGGADHVRIELSSPEEGEEHGAALDAERVAQKIGELCAKGRKYEEIALLFRTHARIPIYEDILNAYHIPCINHSSVSFWRRQEILDMEQIFRIVVDPEDDLAWTAYLRSPIHELNDRVLLEWAQGPGNWETRLTARKFEGSDAADHILSTVRKWRDYAERMPAVELFWKILEESEYEAYCASKADAERSLANLNALAEWIYEQANTHRLTLPAIVQAWMRMRGARAEEAESGTEEGGAVSLMSIHKAKGLEKPVIFFVGIDAKANTAVDSFLYDTELGIGFQSARGSGRYELVKEKVKAANLEEEKRVLYVALTRPKEHLVLTLQTGSVQNYRKVLSEFEMDPIALPRMQSRSQDSLDYKEPAKTKISFPNLNRFADRLIGQRKKFSISEADVYFSCPRDWYYRYAIGLKPNWASSLLKDVEHGLEYADEFTLSGAKKGTLFHRMAEFDDTIEISACIDRASRELFVNPSNREREELANWLRSYRTKKPKGKLRHELEFEWERNGILWTGSVDLLHTTDNGYEIYDFKTNRSDEGLGDRYALQMRFYAIAMEALYGKLPIRASLWWLPGDRMLEADLSKRSLEEVEEKLNEFTRFALSKKSLREIPMCENCKHHCVWSSICINNAQ